MQIAGKEYERLILFYKSTAWKKLRQEVLKMDNYECQNCKAHGRYSKAQTVHHINHVKNRPDLALSIYDDNGERNLISLCNKCHNEEHPEKRQHFLECIKKKEVLTEERW